MIVILCLETRILSPERTHERLVENRNAHVEEGLHGPSVPSHLQDLLAQGKPVSVRARMTRWRCRNDRCERRIFAERLYQDVLHNE